jgi:hypothetical protein
MYRVAATATDEGIAVGNVGRLFVVGASAVDGGCRCRLKMVR